MAVIAVIYAVYKVRLFCFVIIVFIHLKRCMEDVNSDLVSLQTWCIHGLGYDHLYLGYKV